MFYLKQNDYSVQSFVCLSELYDITQNWYAIGMEKSQKILFGINSSLRKMATVLHISYV